LERDDFHKRFRDQRPISLHEFLYPLIQGYDSVVLEADVELGGTDQKFNLLVGRELQRLIDIDLRPVTSGKLPQVVITLPLLEGTEAKKDETGVLVGKKMSKSYGNAIGLDEPPSEIFGKVMSISDDLMWRYYELLTNHKVEEMRNLHPREAKIRLAEELVSRFYDAKSAKIAREEFEQRYGRREFLAGEEIWVKRPDSREGPDYRLLIDVLFQAGLVSSKSEARRLVQQGAVEVNEQKVNDPHYHLSIGHSYEVRIGKHRFYKINLKNQ